MRYILLLICSFFYTVCFGQIDGDKLQMNKVKDLKVLNSFYFSPEKLVVVNDSFVYFEKIYNVGEAICRYNLNNGRLYEYMIPDRRYHRLERLISTPNGVFALYVNLSTESKFDFAFRLYYICGDDLVEVKELTFRDDSFSEVKDYNLKRESAVILSGLYIKDALLSGDRVICAAHYPTAAIQVTSLSSNNIELYGGENPPYPDTLTHEERRGGYDEIRLVENPSDGKKFALVYLKSVLSLQIISITDDSIEIISECNIIRRNRNIDVNEIREYVKFIGRDSLTKKPIVDTLEIKSRRGVTLGDIGTIMVYGVDVVASPKYIYMLNSGKRFMTRNHHSATELYIADWDGKLVGHYELEFPVIKLHYDNLKGKLYGIGKPPKQRDMALMEIQF